MILIQHAGGSDVATCAIDEAVREPIPIVASAPDLGKPVEISFNRRFFACGDQHIRLEHDLVAEAYPDRGIMRIKGWGMEFKFYEQMGVNYDRLLIRKFLDLYSKAEIGNLTSGEQEDWMSIVSQVDYQQFCAERSPEVYVEGTFLQEDSDQWRVRWHDGTEQAIPYDTGRDLVVLDEGQRFGAMVRFGKDNAVQALKNITFIAEPALTGEELWQSWPTTAS